MQVRVTLQARQPIGDAILNCSRGPCSLPRTRPRVSEGQHWSCEALQKTWAQWSKTSVQICVVIIVWKLNSIYVTLDHKTSLKGIVHPKNENSVIIYSPSSCSKPVRMSLFWQTRRKIFWRKFVTRLFWGTIDFHSRTNNTMEENGAPELLFPTFFKISSFVFSRTKTFIQVWNYMRVSK